MKQMFTGPPTITTHPRHQLTICNSASFTCAARGFGVIKVTWKRVDYELPITAYVTEKKSLNVLYSTLNFNNIVGYYSGQYYCIAENEAGMVTSQAATLHVQSKITCVSMYSIYYITKLMHIL